MSVKLMTKVYEAHFHDIEITHKGKKKGTGEDYQKKVRILNSNLKSVCLALSDHANDEGEGAYPSLDTIVSKTELSRPTVIFCLKAMKQENIILRCDELSKWGTVNYTINKDKLVEMASWERQKREKPASKATLPGKAALLPPVKPLDSDSKATLPEPSLNHPLNHLEADASGSKTSEQPARRTHAKILGDPMDGILEAARAAEEKAQRLGLPLEVSQSVESYPVDCQEGARLMYQKFNLYPPSRPKTGKGGDYADWINGIRELLSVCSQYNVTLEDGFREFYSVWNKDSFPFDRPGSMIKTMRSALAVKGIRSTPAATVEPLAEKQAVPNPNKIRPTFGRPQPRTV